MDYHQNARLTIHSREQMARKVLEQGVTLKLAAASFNVSAKTAAKWVRPLPRAGAAGLADRFASAPLSAVHLFPFIGKGFGSSPAALERLAHRPGSSVSAAPP